MKTFRDTSISMDLCGYGMFTIHTAGRFRIRDGLFMEVTELDDGVVLSDSTYRFHSAGRTLGEALVDLGEDMELVWGDYAMADDSELHISGLELKRWALENLEPMCGKWRSGHILRRFAP